jgi:hypothetical protein
MASTNLSEKMQAAMKAAERSGFLSQPYPGCFDFSEGIRRGNGDFAFSTVSALVKRGHLVWLVRQHGRRIATLARISPVEV